MGHLRRERIIVADPNFIDGHRVVFIDDGNDLEFDEGGQRVPGVQESTPVGQIVMGEKNLRDLDAEPLKGFFIGPHQPALSDRCCRLLHR